MASDSFNRADEDPLGSPWAAWGTENLKIVGNICRPSSGVETVCGMAYSTSNVASSEVTIAATGNYDWGPMIHGTGSGGTRNGYVVTPTASSTNIAIGKVTNGSFSNLGSATVSAYQIGDRIRLTRSGDDLVAYINDVEKKRVTDTTWTGTTGSPGISCYDPNARVSAWTDTYSAPAATGVPKSTKFLMTGIG